MNRLTWNLITLAILHLFPLNNCVVLCFCAGRNALHFFSSAFFSFLNVSAWVFLWQNNHNSKFIEHLSYVRHCVESFSKIISFILISSEADAPLLPFCWWENWGMAKLKRFVESHIASLVTVCVCVVTIFFFLFIPKIWIVLYYTCSATCFLLLNIRWATFQTSASMSVSFLFSFSSHLK